MKKSSIIIVCSLIILCLSITSCYYYKGNLVSINKFEKKVSNFEPKALKANYSNYLSKGKTLYNTQRNKSQFYLADSILPFWFGTKWDYNGTTLQPRKGKIACGYFITNTLHSIGHPLKRIWYAQQASSVLIKGICEKNSIKTFWGNNLNRFENYFKNASDGLYLIGLDNHVGYAYKKENNYYFIHSNSWPHGRVVKEHLFTAKNITGSNIKMVGKIRF